MLDWVGLAVEADGKVKQIALQGHRTDLAQFLVQHGADILIQDCNNRLVFQAVLVRVQFYKSNVKLTISGHL